MDVDKEIIYYTDNQLGNEKLFKLVQEKLKEVGLPILSVALKKQADIGDKRLIVHGNRSHTTLYIQILMGLLVSEADYVFLAEHDILYHPSHFEFTPPTKDKYYYNNNVYKYRLRDRKVIKYDCHWLSQLCASRQLLINHFIKRFKVIANGQRAYGYEPGTGQSKRVDGVDWENWESEYPNIDIRHGENWTGSGRMKVSEFRDKSTCENLREYEVKDIPGWDTELLWNLAS